jgi:hypothetical protein
LWNEPGGEKGPGAFYEQMLAEMSREGFLAKFNMKCKGPPNLKADNKGAVDTCHSCQIGKGLRRTAIRERHVATAQENGDTDVQKVDGTKNRSDGLTKVITAKRTWEIALEQMQMVDWDGKWPSTYPAKFRITDQSTKTFVLEISIKQNSRTNLTKTQIGK